MCYPKRTRSVPTRNTKTTQSNHNEVGGIPFIGECLVSAGLSRDTADIIVQSWRLSTRKQYGSYFKRWVQFCHQQQIDKINPSLGEILTYLTRLHNEGLSYSAINTAKSMLSSMFEIIHKSDIGGNILIKRFMKGIYHLKPVVPKTLFTWDVKTVLRYLENMDNDLLTLRLLSIKVALLIILTTGQRCQTLKAMNLRNIEVTKSFVKIRIGELLKQSKPQKHLAELFIEAFDSYPAICVVRALRAYLMKTKNLRTDSSLFIITQKPYSAASKSTIAGWLKLGMRLAGIDLNLFTPHSTRSASTSATVNKVPIDTIIKTAGWSNDCTFRKFYKRPVSNDATFSSAILASQ